MTSTGVPLAKAVFHLVRSRLKERPDLAGIRPPHLDVVRSGQRHARGHACLPDRNSMTDSVEWLLPDHPGPGRPGAHPRRLRPVHAARVRPRRRLHRGVRPPVAGLPRSTANARVRNIYSTGIPPSRHPHERPGDSASGVSFRLSLPMRCAVPGRPSRPSPAGVLIAGLIVTQASAQHHRRAGVGEVARRSARPTAPATSRKATRAPTTVPGPAACWTGVA